MSVAVHEAAHAVIHHGLGSRIRAASISNEDREPSDPVGFVLLEAPGPRLPTLGVIGTAAGPAATFRLYGEPFRLGEAELDMCLAATRGDAGEIARGARWLERKHPGTTARAHFLHAVAMAADLVSRPTIWRAIMDCAHLLVRQQAEYGVAIHSNIEQHIAFGSLTTPLLELTCDEVAEFYA